MTNSQTSIQNENSSLKKFDLEERTAKFGEVVIVFCKTIKIDDITRPLVNQLIRSATSVGANYMEANGADSKPDFRSKVSICKKEAKETMHWLRMISTATPDKATEARKLWQESRELSLIFGAINRK